MAIIGGKDNCSTLLIAISKKLIGIAAFLENKINDSIQESSIYNLSNRAKDEHYSSVCAEISTCLVDSMPHRSDNFWVVRHPCNYCAHSEIHEFFYYR
ncbi:hypothetical protein CCP3SC5AM1_430004 [Gammaproteobacteria bacterium]